MHEFSLPKILTALLCAAQLAAHAAELGEPVVRSHVGQPLVADIELLAGEGGAVRAVIAHDDVYRGANIARSPVIDSLHMSVMRRDGRQFLHITSIKAVEAGYVHLFLELSENGKRDIRPATLWLTPEPPAPPRRVVAPVPAVAAPIAAQVAAPAAAPAPLPPAPAARPRAVRAPDLACQALDYKNAQLAAQIVDLEEKVKALQAAIDMQAVPVRPAAVAAPVRQRAAAARPKAATGHMPAWIGYAGAGAGVIVALGGGFAHRRRRIRAEQQPVTDARADVGGAAPDEPAA